MKVQETVYHPGHFRIALAVNSPTELPLDPKATTMTNDKGAVISVSGEVMPVAPPVLVDKLFQHNGEKRRSYETDVTIPNINCKSCTLQVIQFMEAHPVNNPGQFTYHHCAVLHITADPGKPHGYRLDGGAALSAATSRSPSRRPDRSGSGTPAARRPGPAAYPRRW